MGHTQIIVGYTYSGLCLACAIAIAIAVIRYARITKHKLMQRRYTRVVIFAAILQICLLAFERPVYTELYMTGSHGSKIFGNRKSRAYIRSSQAHIVLWICCMHIGLWLYALRTWLLVFEVNFTAAIVNSQWMSLINNKLHAMTNNWYLQHKHNFGNSKFVHQLVFICFCTSCSISISTANSQFTKEYWIFVDFILLCIPLLMIAVTYLKCPEFEDHFMIAREIRMFMRIGFGGLLVYMLSLCIFLFGDPSNYTLKVCTSFCFTALITAIGLQSTEYVRHITKEIRQFDTIAALRHRTSNNSELSISRSKSKSKSKSKMSQKNKRNKKDDTHITTRIKKATIHIETEAEVISSKLPSEHSRMYTDIDRDIKTSSDFPISTLPVLTVMNSLTLRPDMKNSPRDSQDHIEEKYTELPLPTPPHSPVAPSLSDHERMPSIPVIIEKYNDDNDNDGNDDDHSNDSNDKKTKGTMTQILHGAKAVLNAVRGNLANLDDGTKNHKKLSSKSNKTSKRGQTILSLRNLSSKSTSRSTRSLGLSQILKSDIGFQKFITYCCYELNTENLLGYVELVQFRKMYVEQGPTHKKRFQLPPNIVPQSGIVYDSNLSVVGKAIRLCEKYVSNDALFQLNIEFTTRERLVKASQSKFINQNPQEIGMAFDQVLHEIHSLLMDSFWRFRKTKAFYDLKQLIL